VYITILPYSASYAHKYTHNPFVRLEVGVKLHSRTSFTYYKQGENKAIVDSKLRPRLLLYRTLQATHQWQRPGAQLAANVYDEKVKQCGDT